jgi:hypothetical protein
LRRVEEKAARGWAREYECVQAKRLHISVYPLSRRPTTVVLNAPWSAERVVGREGRVAEALPHDDVVALLEAHRRL